MLRVAGSVAVGVGDGGSVGVGVGWGMDVGCGVGLHAAASQRAASRKRITLLAVAKMSVSAVVAVVGLSDEVTALAAGSHHTCALTSSGGIQCWGINSHGQLGEGTTTSTSTPVGVTGLSSVVTTLAAGRSHTCASTNADTVKCWGSNVFGQLGDGTAGQLVDGTADVDPSKSTPVAVAGLSSEVTTLVANSNHTCARIKDGGVKHLSRRNQSR